MRCAGFASVFFAIFWLIVTSCAARKNPEPHFQNPMPAIWASIQAQIDELKKGEAAQRQWRKLADNASRISTLEDLHKAIAATGVSADPLERERQQKHLENLFHASHRTIHFGFECDHHAIVFFDSVGRQLYVYP